jgi:hypothetical protein
MLSSIPACAAVEIPSTVKIIAAERMVLCPTIQVSHARRATKPSLLKYGAMLSGNIVGDLGEIKGVALWMTGSPFLSA